MLTLTTDLRHDPWCSCRTSFDVVGADGPKCPRDYREPQPYLDPVTGETEYYWLGNPIDMGVYDDDPNPYHGTYSEE